MTRPTSSEGRKLRRYMCCPIPCQQQHIHSLGTLKPDKSMTPPGSLQLQSLVIEPYLLIILLDVGENYIDRHCKHPIDDSMKVSNYIMCN
jgi:hypothetical protein